MAEAESADMAGNGPGMPRILALDLRTRFGRLQGNLAVPAGGIRLAELAWNAMALDERLISLAMNSEARQGRKVSCTKGCGACCRQAVPLSPPEAWMLADLVASFPLERRAAVLERFTAARDRLHREGFGERSLGSTASPQEVLALGLDYFRLGIPCPFLAEESCSIHPQRPTSCREFLVTSPAALCAVPGVSAVQGVPMAASLTESLARLTAMLLGGEPQVIPMVLALEWALEHREEGLRRFDAAFLMTALVETMTSS